MTQIFDLNCNDMGRKKLTELKGNNFGERLAEIRQKEGLSQYDLADMSGISQRMIAHYEKPEASPPAHAIVKLAEALGVSSDILLGLKQYSGKARKRASSQLTKRIRQIEKLPARERKQIINLLDTFLEREKLRQETK